VTHIVADTFVSRHADVLTAVGTLVVGFLSVVLIDRFLVRRAGRLAAVVTTDLSQAAATRLRFLRRAVEATIIIITIAIALSQFAALDRVGRTILASGAIAAAVVGFAARQTLANAVAGIMLAVVQPVRIGDCIAFEDEVGTVEDVGLTYTWMRNGADARILIPNERLAAGMLRNDSIRSPTVEVEVSVWVAHDADESRALAAIEALGVRARIAEATHDGLRILVMGESAPPTERAAREGELRLQALQALREAQLR
jgi:small-conductance mechanosensitive channel